MKWQWNPTDGQLNNMASVCAKYDAAKMYLAQRKKQGSGNNGTQKRHFAELRNMTFDEYVGQEKAVVRLLAAITAAKWNDSALPHCAFIGPAGMGKTSLASCVANLLGREARMTVGSAITNMDDVASFVESVNGGIAFVDEAHDLARAELPIVSGLLPLLEDFMLHMETGSRPVLPFTMIFATTTFGMLDPAIRSRMGIPYELSDYNHKELMQIAQLHAERQQLPPLPDRVAEEIARRCRGNPRTCGNLVKEIHNFSIAAGGNGNIIYKDCMKTFEVLGIDENGFSETDWTLLNKLNEGPLAITRCAGYLGMDKKTFEATIFPYLFKRGLIIIYSRGVQLTDAGVELVN